LRDCQDEVLPFLPKILVWFCFNMSYVILY
jgi:hypothetical protein